VNDASPVASTGEFRFRSDIENAPTGKKLQLINEGGVAVYGVLTNDNRHHYIEWQYCLKRSLKTTHPGDMQGPQSSA